MTMKRAVAAAARVRRGLGWDIRESSGDWRDGIIGGDGGMTNSRERSS
jgi:hypothetical protein